MANKPARRKLNPDAQLNRHQKRKAAPNIRTYSRDRIAERDQIRMDHQDSLPADQREERTLCYMHKDNVTRREIEGWKICGRIKDGKVNTKDFIHHKGDVLMWMPKRDYLAKKRQSELEAVEMLDQAVEGEAAGDVIKDKFGDEHRLTVTPE